jgi:ABC-type multidrug transport system ATPase subunit
MSETIVNALVHLFAIFESVKEDFEQDTGELIVKPYLQKTLNQELTDDYIHLFHDYLSFYREANRNPSGDHELGIDSTSIIQIAKICNQINKELKQSERIVVFIELLELIRADEKVSDKEGEFASLVAMNFNLMHKEVEHIKAFIFEPDSEKISYDRGLVIDNKMTEWPEEVAWMMRKKKADIPGSTRYHHMHVENLFGRILVLFLESVDSYIFRYDGPLNLYLEGNRIIPRKTYFLNPGAIVKGPNIKSIYETEITKQFLKDRTKVKIVLSGEDLEFKFKNSENGIQKFNFSEESGHLVAIMGGSGTGKSTLLNLLNGNLDPTRGRVHINGHNITRASREGVIGYVPQDDLLFEELTVYQNLYYNAKICFSDFSNELIKKTVEKVLADLDLTDIKSLKVGDPLNKTISGGQRKRLNIALELMREPSVLFVDEPTSGLSSMDSEKVMWLLKDLARKGKLVIAIIHQPSSEIYKLMDRLWILDKGGYPIYNGNPIDAIVYFKTMSTQVNAAESECPRCGNVIPDHVLHIIEAKEIDDNGNETPKRRVPAKNWYLKYRENIEKNLKRIRFKEQLPPTNFNIPNKLKQFEIYSKRNLLSKISNRQYILINLLEAPLLAFVLAFFSKYTMDDGSYIFAENRNLPVFIFMSIVVSLFVGMSVSAEEIFKDRKILVRESFLNLSRVSYLNSKITFLFVLSAFQAFSFVAIGNWILEIQGQLFLYWIILFSTACFANMVGLNISSALNSIITIYILIPFILVPQLLLGGAMISFDDLHSDFTNKKYVPIVGDMMVSRWAYEALCVGQFQHNDYMRYFFDVEQEMSESSFQSHYVIPRLENLTRTLKKEENPQDYPELFHLLRNEIEILTDRFEIPSYPLLNTISPDYFNGNYADRVMLHLNGVNETFKGRYRLAVAKKDSIYYALVDKMGKDGFLKMKQDYFNENVADIVTNANRIDKLYVEDIELIQKKDPIFTRPYSKIGRAHFFAPYKILGNLKIKTVTFDVLVIWLFSLVLYFVLINDYIKRFLEFFAGRKYRRNTN